MLVKRIIHALIIILLLCLIVGIWAFFYNASNSYKISSGFTSVPLQFNPDDSSSSYRLKNTQITVRGGFVKGLLSGKDGPESVVIRALSPLPSIEVTGSDAGGVSLVVENINPDFYAGSISAAKVSITKVKVNSLKLKLDPAQGGTVKIDPVQPNTGKIKFIILGDNRDGYHTFKQIIEQVNAQNPAFVIDNGDLVYSGKPNQYRLFDKLTARITTTLCTTLGNHDIRKNGRSIYAMLYGPAYYSFDFDGSHFVFLDSSPGWVEKQAISDEQYSWLEKDLTKAQGEKIFVITHIPPQDPRAGAKSKTPPDYINGVKGSGNQLEQKLNNYEETKGIDHGFRDPKEAERFEKLMSAYHVDTVYLSHIHSYMEYSKGGVRYMITGGAGAELLTVNSYYHYLIQRIGDTRNTTMVELPSPANEHVARYLAAAELFANAMYEENPVAVSFVIAGLVLLVILLILWICILNKRSLLFFGIWIRDVAKYAAKHRKELSGRDK